MSDPSAATRAVRIAGLAVVLSIIPTAMVPEPFAQPGVGVGFNVFLDPLLFGTVYAQDLPASALAAQQRPITLAALTDKSGLPAWKSIPSWYMVARDDRAIPAAAERFMARRAGSHTVEVSSSHMVIASHPAAVARLIVEAALATR